jgi:hypothetical protein
VDVITFVRARLDEAEARARKYVGRYIDGEWARVICDPVIGPFGGQDRIRDIATGMYVAKLSDPSRVLREVAVLRSILNRHTSCAGGIGYCQDGGHGWESPAGAMCGDLLDLAVMWDDNPDYDTRWEHDAEDPDGESWRSTPPRLSRWW